MRLVGERSAASVLRWVLGVMNVFVSIGAVIMIPIGMALLLLAGIAWVDPDFYATTLADRGATVLRPIDGGDTPAKDWRIYVQMLNTAVFLAMLWWVLNRLRKILATITARDPFQPANVGRLQGIGTALAAIQLAGMLLPLITPRGIPAPSGSELDLSAWLGVLVLFILAEVFREGARLRDETADLV